MTGNTLQLIANPSVEESLTVYRAITVSKAFALSGQGLPIFGSMLVRVYSNGFDVLAEEYSQDSDCCDRVLIPTEGLVVGKLYYTTCVNVHRDWETNAVDSWDISIVEYPGALPNQPTIDLCSSAGFKVLMTNELEGPEVQFFWAGEPGCGVGDLFDSEHEAWDDCVEKNGLQQCDQLPLEP